MKFGIKGHRGLIIQDKQGNVIYKKLGFGENICFSVGNLTYGSIIGVTAQIIDDEEHVFICSTENICVYNVLHKYSVFLDYPNIKIHRAVNKIFSIHKQERFKPYIMFDSTENDIFPYYFSCINDRGVNVLYGYHGFVVENNYIAPQYDRDCYYFKDYLKCTDIEKNIFKTNISKQLLYDYDIECIMGITNFGKIVVKIENIKNGNIVYRSKKIPNGVFNKLQWWGWWLSKINLNEFELYISYTCNDESDFFQTIKIDI